MAKNLGFQAAEATTSFLGVTPIGWAVIGGLMAIGVASTYMAQIEGTKLKQLQDNWLAKKNAVELSKGRAKTPEVEYPQNQRSDNQLWTQVEEKNRLKLVHNQVNMS